MKHKDKKLLVAADQAQVWEMASLEMEGMIHDLNKQIEMLRARIDEMDECVLLFFAHMLLCAGHASIPLRYMMLVSTSV